MALPLNRLYLAHTLSEPRLLAEALFYARRADGRTAIYRQSLTTGLAQAVTTEPAPSGGVGYGGGLYAVRENLLVYAGKDGRLHRVDLNTGDQRPITPPHGGVAAPAFSPDGRFVVYLAEQDDRCNVLVVDAFGASLPVRLSENPWYAFNPTLSPDGRCLAWMEWDEHAMPWDESRVVVAYFAQPVTTWGLAADPLPLSLLTLGRPGYAFSAPQFSPDGRHLFYASDESGWRSLYVTPLDAPDLQTAAQRLDLGPGEAGGPDWVPGQLRGGWAEGGRALYALRHTTGRAHLLRFAWPTLAVSEVVTGWPWLSELALSDNRAALLVGSPTQPEAVITVDLPNGPAVARATSAVGVCDPAALVTPEVIQFPTVDGRTASGIFYRARVPAGGDAPRPTLVLVHGGPTSERTLTWDAPAQYFATRGWHYLLVNHRGGTGSGRDFQHLLDGQWGVVDVQDARAAAEHLVWLGLADPARLVITGASAGGYTTLMALTQDPDFWAAGVSTAGISQHYDLLIGSHRFEINYNDTLLGRLPEAGPLWKARSPLTHVKSVRAPVLLFHGRDDRAVPVQQSIDFAEAVRRQGGVAELVVYEGEGHGVHREANRRDQIERMERFLDKYVLARQ
ncbi:MAG: S9 family peptidase [Anaerolineales bacterium]|nr:S9 family peptidase [Anaerolineales bacterium]